MRYLLAICVLYLFWLILSGHFTVLLLGLGVLSVSLVVWLLRRMDQVDGECETLYPSVAIASYGGWLSWSVVKSNIDVTRRIWDPRLPIDPNWSRLNVDLTTPLSTTLYANSITLTPGTLTADVQPGHFLVHSLSSESIDDLREGDMERRIRALGI